ncbi:MAG: (2Fe-2S) ferredoxin domain-containing protein [Oscillospiraceae bacterium]|nr:(2Fe-2S) ferredoxin domain-containing protein [Oscillospiraceae bacterium]
MTNPKYHVFVCTSCRMNGVQKGFCFNKGSVDIVNKFMQEIEDRELSGEVMITNTGCFGICSRGPIAVVYPQGIWYGDLTPEKVEEIVERHIENGEVVKEYQI